MFSYVKSLEYPVKIKNTNPALAKFIISQYGGPYNNRLLINSVPRRLILSCEGQSLSVSALPCSQSYNPILSWMTRTRRVV